MEKIKLSIIVPTRNRADYLHRTLLSVEKQKFPKENYEVIVCDNNSSDNTKEICDTLSKSFNHFQYHKTLNPGLHVGRHCGLKYANSEYLIFIDDDIEATTNWLSTIYNIFESNPEVVLIGGKNLPKFESAPPLWLDIMWNQIDLNGNKILADLSLIDLGNDEREISPYYVFGCNFSVRKSLIVNAKGFHPDGMPFDLIRFRGDGETYISRYIKENKLKTYYHPDATVFHWVSNDRMTVDYFYKRKYMQGVSDAYTFLRTTKGIVKKNNKKFIRKIITLFRIILGFSQSRELFNLNELISKSSFKKNCDFYYNNGFQLLINYYKSDPEVKSWVHKENYLNET